MVQYSRGPCRLSGGPLARETWHQLTSPAAYPRTVGLTVSYAVFLVLAYLGLWIAASTQRLPAQRRESDSHEMQADPERASQFEQENDLGRGGGEVDDETLDEARREAARRRSTANGEPDDDAAG